MTDITELGQLLITPLNELENAYNINRERMWAEVATDAKSDQIESTFYSITLADELQDLVVLAYKQYHDQKREIVRSLTTPTNDTTSEEERLVTWKVEDIAAEFCRTKGLIPDLIACLNQAEIGFSEIESIVAEYDCFHSDDYEEEGHIVIRIDVNSNQDTAFKEYEDYNGWMLENTGDKGLEYFIVTVRRLN
jgi:hypothetical protein